MVEVDAHDRRCERVGDVGRVEPSAQAHLEHRGIDRRPAKQLERHRRRDLEEGRLALQHAVAPHRVDRIPHVERLDQIAPFIAKIRISKGISQTDLAGRLGVSKQVISRYEESDYQTVAISRLQEILDAIGIKTVVTLSA